MATDSLNKGEIGQVIRVNYGSDISSAASVKIFIEPEFGTLKEFVATVPGVPVTVNGVTFEANEYAEYTTLSEEDLDYIGRNRKKVKVEFSSTDIQQTNYEKFRVLA